jgi:hypothetical protein
MSLIKPQISIAQKTYDARNLIEIPFQVIGGDQVTANEIQVYENSNNLLAYDYTTEQQYFLLKSVIPGDTLNNGTIYKIRIRTLNSAGAYSQFSDWVIISCYTQPTIDIINIDDNGVYNNQQLVPQASYSQAEGDSLRNYQYFLYDNSMNLLGKTSLLYDGELTVQLGILENNQSYYVKLQVTSQSGATSELTKHFTAEYIAPTFSNLLTLTNDRKNAKVDIEIIAIRTVGHIKSGTAKVQDDPYVNLLNGILQFDDQDDHGLYFKYNQGNWQMQMWLKGLIDNYTPINYVLEGTTITVFIGDNGVMFKLEYYNGMFHLYKYIVVNNKYKIMSHYVSNIINATSNDVVYLFMNCQNDRIGMQAINLSNNNLKNFNYAQLNSYLYNQMDNYKYGD